MAFTEQSSKRDFYQELTDKITARIKEGIECADKGLKWEKPIIEINALPYNPFTGKPYSGANLVNLASEGYADPRFLTFNQMQLLEKQTGERLKLKKGSKASLILIALDVYEKDEKGRIKKDENGESIPVLDENGRKKKWWKEYCVFNCSLIEGIAPYIEATREIKPVEEVDLLGMALQERTNLKTERSDKLLAYYSPSQHLIHMPEMKYFKDDLAYARTAAHEYLHSTGPALGRKQEGGFGSVSYAKEELVAELGSYFIGHSLGIGSDPSAHENHAAYMRSWLKVLKDDKTFIAKAANMAGKAVDYQLEHLNAYKQDLKLKQELLDREWKEKLARELPKSEKKKKAVLSM